MGGATNLYRVFETASGFCGIAWSDVGITRFLLPTKSTEAAERMMLRRLPDAESGTPAPEVTRPSLPRSFISGAKKRIFQTSRWTSATKTNSSSGSTMGTAGPMGPHDHLWRFGERSRRRSRGCARRRSSHGQKPGAADHPLPQSFGGRRQAGRFFCAWRLRGKSPHARVGRRQRRKPRSAQRSFTF